MPTPKVKSNMKVKRISASIGKTINLGNYESCKVSIGAEADVDISIKDVNKCYKELVEQLTDVFDAVADDVIDELK